MKKKLMEVFTKTGPFGVCRQIHVHITINGPTPLKRNTFNDILNIVRLITH
ncbi:hypothetical protein Hanom_Chr05g00390351 [Helianthus anomalus]